MTDQAPEPPRLRIDGTWLVAEFDYHTCGAGPGSYGGMHEPGCGLIPEVDAPRVRRAARART